MATAFKVNVPVTTPVNFVDVQNNLPVGRHTFTLVVVDAQGNRSNPARATVLIQGTGPGRPVIVPPIVGPVPAPPSHGPAPNPGS
jgi:hypothetical protein